MTILSVFFEVISPKHARACSPSRGFQIAWNISTKKLIHALYMKAGGTVNLKGFVIALQDRRSRKSNVVAGSKALQQVNIGMFDIISTAVKLR